MLYRQDHVRLLKVFAKELPKRPSLKVADLTKAFSDIQKRKPDCASLSPDRACRNALRKPRAEGHIEIAERGEYRLTQKGVAFCKTLDKFEAAPDRKDGEPRTKKSKGKKAAKKVAKKATAKKAVAEKTVAEKSASVTKAVKKAVAPKKESKSSAEKKVEASEPKKTNGKKSSPILPPSRKASKPTAAEQADAAAIAAEAASEDPDEVGGDPEPTEDLADQLSL